MPDTPLKPGLEIGEDGHPVGRDPRQMTQAELKKAGHFPRPALDAIRAHCIDCCGGQLAEVRRCLSVDCNLWDRRMGTDPLRVRASPAQRRQREAALERAADEKISRRAGQKISGTGPEASEHPADLSLKKSAPEPRQGHSHAG